ncbi:MAG: protein translocase subunit SecD [Pyrinomonadaceae bacterium]|nr:protein translocase subunit SecD [Pyrinomonadaceae bacterium]
MKNSSLLVRTIIIFVVLILGLYLVIGPRNSFKLSDFSWQGIKNNLAENINLGLDLKGGSHLVMRVKTDEYLRDLTVNNRDAALNAAKEAQLPVGEATSTAENRNYQFTINVTDPNQVDAVIEAVKKKVDLVNWTESKSSNSVTWSLPLQVQNVLKIQATEQAMQIIESRINAFGVKEPTLATHGREDSGQILLQMPGVDDPERVKDLIGKSSKLELMKVVSPPNPSPVQTFPTKEAAEQSIAGAPNRRVLEFVERDENAPQPKAGEEPPKQWVVVETPAVVDGSELRDASAVQSTAGSSDYQISFSFKPAGAQKFGEWTGKNIGNYMGVVLDDKVKSIAYIKSQIFDQGQIDGRFTKESGEDLALTLKSGALPAQIDYQEERTVGPSLGADSIKAGVRASAGGLAFVIAFMLFYYRGAGINAVVALLLNMLLTLAALIVLDSTLTLPGIAGLILGIGMAVDSNVLIFERMREEIRDGKEIRKAIELGFDRAFITIIDTHVTTIIAAVILYLYGSGPIRGFAVTLVLGLIINLFSAVFVSKTIFLWLLERNPNMKKISV